MSGEEYTHTVRVRVAQREVTGCGRVLATGDMTGIYWKLVELDGRPVLATAAPQEAHLRLSDDGSTVTGSTGCNGFRGRAQLTGERVKFGPLASTLMACLDPALGDREKRYLRGLESANRLIAEGDGLTMYAGERVAGPLPWWSRPTGPYGRPGSAGRSCSAGSLKSIRSAAPSARG